MVPETPSTPAVEASAGDDGYDWVINAIIGAVVGIVLSFIPLSPLLGGVIAGYLEGGDPNRGLKVGAVAGAIMLLPLAFIGTVLLFLLGFGIGSSTVAFGVMALLVLLLSAVYTVGLSVVGGYLGVYLENEL